MKALDKEQKDYVVELLDELNDRCHKKGHCISFEAFKKEKGLIEQFEVGKWYKCINTKALVHYQEDNYYGFDNNGNWGDNILMLKNYSYWNEATPQEVEEALIKEWERQGGREGLRNVEPLNGTVMSFDGIRYPLRYSEGRLIAQRGETLFFNGQWAEIVEEKRVGEDRIHFVDVLDFIKYLDQHNITYSNKNNHGIYRHWADFNRCK
jgi:hypothetical protein